ncbi:spore germination protein [Litoribacterium kuwaitense]|uniref:spore germination protein n=1 Tax=Litoribacterium kuwaitense TaxID=1398745 RepID=UPI001FE3F9AA|nr:spore germination protein [Litoribacterium kuwaitense]
MLLEDAETGLAIDVQHHFHRNLEEPVAESVVRGNRIGFIESIDQNIALLRNYLKTDAFLFETLILGKYTKTTVGIAYIDGVAERKLIEEVRMRLEHIEADGVIETGDIEELIEDHPNSIFPQMVVTERVDVVVSSMLEGKVAILVNGTPFVLVVPGTFFSLTQSPDDYYQRFFVGSFIRLLRLFFIFIALCLPAIYVAFSTFHQELIPSQLLLTIVVSREAIPFPAVVELLIMDITFEGLREAGLRLPKQIGAAVSIVGALVIGEASVNAGLVSRPMVVIIALTGIASFIMPRFNLSTSFRLLRFPLTLAAASFGFIGLFAGLMMILTHLCSLRSFGVPFMEPIAPLHTFRLKDSFIRRKIK